MPPQKNGNILKDLKETLTNWMKDIINTINKMFLPSFPEDAPKEIETFEKNVADQKSGQPDIGKKQEPVEILDKQPSASLGPRGHAVLVSINTLRNQQEISSSPEKGEEKYL